MKSYEDNNRAVGSGYEEIAARFAEKHGAVILLRNFRCRIGEIDLILKDGDYLVFAEVKYRKDNKKGTPEEAVGPRKQYKICKVADYYRMQNRIPGNAYMRFDVIAICGNHIIWHKGAFDYRSKLY